MMALVTGGASSGKSAYAESLACALPGARFYLAAMAPYGEEGARRIARHRALRAGKGFTTLECYEGLSVVPAKLAKAAEGEGEGEGAFAGAVDHLAGGLGSTALLESLGNVAANALFRADGSMAPLDDALVEIMEGVEQLSALFGNLVIVGDEVGGDGLRYDDATCAYIRLIGTAACAIAARCDVVVECVAGQPLVAKGACALEALGASAAERRGGLA